MTEQKVEKIKARVLIPFALLVTVVLVVGIGGMFFIQREVRNERVRKEISQLLSLYQELLASEANHLENLLQYYAQDTALRQAFLRGERQVVMRLAQKHLDLPGDRYKPTHLYFIKPDRTAFLRMQRPEQHGDPINHYTVAQARQTGRSAHGLELGRFGQLTLRVAQPWYADGKVIGFLELGRDIAPIAHELQRILGAELFISINKSRLDRTSWEQSRHAGGGPGAWDEFPRCVLTYRSQSTVPHDICRYIDHSALDLAGSIFHTSSEGRHLGGGVIPVIDASGANLGNIVALFDLTEEFQALLYTMLSFAAGVTGLALLGLYLLRTYVGRLEGRIVRLQNELSGRLAERDEQLTESSRLLQDDIARREQIEREYAKVCLQNKLILESAGQGIFGLDKNGCHTFVNPAAASMLGYSPEELLGKNSHATWHHTRADNAPFPETECPIYRAFKDGKTCRVAEDVFWRKDGSRFWVEYTSTPIREAGRPAGAVVTFQDITPRKAALNALEESEERYRAIIATAQDAIILMDDAGRVDYWNPAAEKIFGYTAAEIMGAELHGKLVPARYREQCGKGIEQFRASGTGSAIGKTVILQALRKNGKEFPVELSLSAIRLHGKWYSAGVVRDISARVLAENERENLQAQVRQAQKMEAIGTLAGGIAHDFNNILGAIMGYTELGLLDAASGKPTDAYLTEIRRASHRAKDLVAQILTIGRQTETRRQPMSVVLIIKEAMKLLRASLPANVKIRQQIDQAAGKVMAEPVQIHQCFMNLCTNAAQALRETGGVLEVTVGEEQVADSKMLRDYALTPGRYLRIAVRDTGQGMDADTLARIFEPFFTTKPRGDGTGLGLSVVHGIMKSHGGGIAVESQPGHGSTFSLYLPLIESAAAEEIAPPVVATPPGGGMERVLFVDDEQQLVELGQRILDYLGYAVTTCTSSREALEIFQARPEDFDLVITDQAMPEMTGVELAKELFTRRPNLPVILCTGFSETINEKQAKAMGIRCYVMKPISVSELATACRQALDSKGG